MSVRMMYLVPVLIGWELCRQRMALGQGFNACIAD